MKTHEIIGKRIQNLRCALGLNSTKLAAKVGISQAQVSRLENGLQGFRRATLKKFAKALGVRIVDLVQEDRKALSPILARALQNRAFAAYLDRAAAAYLKKPKVLAAMDRALARRANSRPRGWWKWASPPCPR
jgi:transcriptional regulator with XRE-family HTH domain